MLSSSKTNGCEGFCFDYEYVQKALDVIGGKWKAALLWHIRGGPKRFNELMRLVEGISHKVLTQQLRQLENDDIISREIYDSVPKRVDYYFTEYGKSLCDVFATLELWGEGHINHQHAE